MDESEALDATLAISRDVLKRYHDLNDSGQPFEAVKEFQTAFAAIYALGYRIGRLESTAAATEEPKE